MKEVSDDSGIIRIVDVQLNSKRTEALPVALKLLHEALFKTHNGPYSSIRSTPLEGYLGWNFTENDFKLWQYAERIGKASYIFDSNSYHWWSDSENLFHMRRIHKDLVTWQCHFILPYNELHYNRFR